VSTGKVRALFFDVGGTLIHPYPSVGAVYASVADRHGICTPADELEQAFRQSWAALKGPGLTVSSKEWWRQVVFRTLGQKNEPCFEELFNTFARPESWQLFPEAEDTLREARTRGLHVGLISNWDERLRPLLDVMGLTHYFDSITISCEVGVEKPSAEIFLAALQAANVYADEAVHIGDNESEDVHGAEGVGMRAVLLNRREHEATGPRDLREIWAKLG